MKLNTWLIVGGLAAAAYFFMNRKDGAPLAVGSAEIPSVVEGEKIPIPEGALTGAGISFQAEKTAQEIRKFNRMHGVNSPISYTKLSGATTERQQAVKAAYKAQWGEDSPPNGW